MKLIPSVKSLASGDSNYLWEYTNTLGDVLRVSSTNIELVYGAETERFSFDEIGYIKPKEHWKSTESERELIIAVNDRKVRFKIDTIRDGYPDIITISRQLNRILISHKT